MYRGNQASFSHQAQRESCSKHRLSIRACPPRASESAASVYTMMSFFCQAVDQLDLVTCILNSEQYCAKAHTKLYREISRYFNAAAHRYTCPCSLVSGRDLSDRAHLSFLQASSAKNEYEPSVPSFKVQSDSDKRILCKRLDSYTYQRLPFE